MYILFTSCSQLVTEGKAGSMLFCIYSSVPRFETGYLNLSCLCSAIVHMKQLKFSVFNLREGQVSHLFSTNKIKFHYQLTISVDTGSIFFFLYHDDNSINYFLKLYNISN